VTSAPRLPQAPELIVGALEDQPFRPALVVDVAAEPADPEELPGLSGTG
jgi:hypothetical protein